MKNKLLTILLLTFVNLINAQAPKEKVLELINVMQADEMINQMMNQMIPALQQQIKANLKTEEEKQKLEKINSVILEEAKTFTKNIVNGPMVNIYAKYFNTEDINYMIDFYKSKTGSKLLELTPTISQELMQEMMQSELPKFQEKIKTEIEKITKSN